MSWYGTAADTTGIAIQPRVCPSPCLDIERSRSRWLGESFVSLRKARKILRRTITDGAQNQAMQRTRDKIWRCGQALGREPLIADVRRTSIV